MRKNVHLLMLLLIALLSGCKEKEAEREKVPTRVMTETVEATGMAGGQSYVGVVEENEGTAVSFTGMGAVRRVYVDEGQMVRRGQLIAEMDDTQARNALSAAEDMGVLVTISSGRSSPNAWLYSRMAGSAPCTAPIRLS